MFPQDVDGSADILIQSRVFPVLGTTIDVWDGLRVGVAYRGETSLALALPAIAAIRAGAYDFVTKPVEMDMLALTLQRAVRHRQLQEQVQVLSEAEYPTRYAGVYMRPEQSRKIFDERGWSEVAALQVRNPMHRSYDYF